MFERFTEHARHVMELAGREAQRFGNEYVGTEHLLWGLAKETHSVAASVLEHFHVDLKPLRREMEEMLKTRPHVESVEKLPQSVHAKEVIQYAVEEARAMHHNYVGTEHLLIGHDAQQPGRRCPGPGGLQSRSSTPCARRSAGRRRQ